ncbi:MAG: gamma-glutamylcyclotransferase [Micavibrio sp.]|nr:gamma-glutamylcyclotransferase [Micavibrio sp.]|tara:strand:+ start:842 stop:1411 length:570 start_codon:yes stop_codon:yes gene_type:complete
MEYWTFGYGSLVNQSTWDDTKITKKATLNGWQREWRHNLEPDTYAHQTALTISQHSNQQIDGILAKVNEYDLIYLKEREKNYEIHYLEHTQFIDLNIDGQIFTHISKPENHGWASNQHPICQSYIDVVTHGYYKTFGLDGLRRFMETTIGWNLPILNDRENPQYPRAQKINQSFLDKVDILIKEAAAAV